MLASLAADRSVPDASSAPALAPGVLQSLVEHGLAVHDHQPRAPGESRALVVLAR